MKFNFIIGSLVWLMAINISPAADTVYGDIRQDTRWSGNLVLSGDVRVLKGVILYIEPTTRIEILPNTDILHSGEDQERVELIIEGSLIAHGEGHPRPIVFTSASATPQPGDWGGIVFKNFSTNSHLENCIVEYACDGARIIGSAPQILGSEFRFNFRAGISCEVRAFPYIEQTIFKNNHYAGLHCELASTPVVQNCEFQANRYGVSIFSLSEPDLGHVPPKQGVSAGKNRFINNTSFDIYNHTRLTIYAQNNLWSSRRNDEIREKIFDNTMQKEMGRVVIQPIYRGLIIPVL
ncbi:MAG: hypothetical protein Kow0037_18470 [Calditrichia bacterium]